MTITSLPSCFSQTKELGVTNDVFGFWKLSSDGEGSVFLISNNETSVELVKESSGEGDLGFSPAGDYFALTPSHKFNDDAKQYLNTIQILFPDEPTVEFTIPDELIWSTTRAINNEQWLVTKYDPAVTSAPEWEIFAPFESDMVDVIDLLPNRLAHSPISVSPDLRWVIYTENQEQDTINLFDTAKMEVVWQIAGFAIGGFIDGTVAWHSDSTIVAMQYEGSTILIEPSDEGVKVNEMQQTTDKWTRVNLAVSWHPVKHVFSFINNETILGLYDVDLQQGKRICFWDNGSHYRRASWSPNGEYIAILSRGVSISDSIYFIETDSHAISKIVEADHLIFHGWSTDNRWLNDP